MLRGIEERIKNLPLLTQSQILEEIYYDPKFAGYIKPLLAGPNPFKAVYIDMRKAVINEVNPLKYSEVKNRWKVLRAKAKKLIKGSAAELRKQATGLDGWVADAIDNVWTGITSQIPKIPEIVIPLVLKDILSEKIPGIIPSAPAPVTPAPPVSPIVERLIIKEVITKAVEEQQQAEKSLLTKEKLMEYLPFMLGIPLGIVMLAFVIKKI